MVAELDFCYGLRLLYTVSCFTPDVNLIFPDCGLDFSSRWPARRSRLYRLEQLGLCCVFGGLYMGSKWLQVLYGIDYSGIVDLFFLA